MKSIGILPSRISAVNILNTLGETIIYADKEYNVIWINAYGTELLSHVAPLFGIKSVEELIGKNMSYFHREPNHQRNIMDNLNRTHHKTRINIKDTYIADITISPIKEDNEIVGFLVLLSDVTNKAKEEQEKQEIIKQLVVPILHIWYNIIATPLKGYMNKDRYDNLLLKLLSECSQTKADYLIIDLSGVDKLSDQFMIQVNNLVKAIRLLGTECLIASISPKSLNENVEVVTDFKGKTFLDVKAAVKYIITDHNLIIEKRN
jgi:rsbT co-antagonist protein RsbR